MLGAIIGDTVGSIYEFYNTKDYNFALFNSQSGYTDDSIMTMAVAYWLLKDPKHRYGYDLERTWKYLHRTYSWHSSCQRTVPEAIICFLESDSFEDAIRKAVSIGGDSDTLACITGGIAEAYYAFIPQEMIDRTIKVFPKIFNKILDEFRTRTEYGM